MNLLLDWLHAQGLSGIPRAHWIEAAITGSLVLVALAVGLVAQRFVGRPLSQAWKGRLTGQAESLGSRLPGIVRHGTAALLLAILINAHDWSKLAAAPVGLALGAATALSVLAILRGLGIARWMAWLVATALFVALFSHAVGGLQPITSTLERIGFDVGKRRFSLLALLTILITVIALYALVRLANRFIAHWVSQSRAFDATQKLLAQKLAGIAVVVVAFFVGVDILDIDLTTFAVFSGALGLAIGFGLQKTVGNLIAGIILLMDRSIKPGDVIVVGEDIGWVNKIGVRAVSVITRDGKEHLIPNENLMTQAVENWSYTDRNVRVRIVVGVSYASDLKLAQQLMLRAADESPRVLDSPKPNVWLTAFGDSAIEHEILVWISDPEGGVGNVRSDVLNRLWWLFKEHGIEIPFPQREVHVRTSPPQDPH
ncbi:mechanosensitive ion channel [Sphingomonas sp. AR_OL41]|uniref:mechanosensitive ion channel family protein n=1 Tax=Sphingomonas sp. AR_OL41 TaxID=3042729 RepID=UPI0024814057|nr:mechanosensitive ion channel domain-containing protein [Sphingomonas sp. AR_OL41]MDH7972693.1 mechanosensitive ion channel [Sphingomonas sp. AR_OL41]